MNEAGPTGRYADLTGVRLWYTDTGGAGIPVVLLHANTGTSANWAPQVQAFAAAGYRVIAFDRRGWGRSLADPATGPQPGSVSEDLHALVLHLDLPRFHLVGVAGGAFEGMDYAAWQPDRIRSLTAAATMGALQEKEITEFSARITVPGLPIVVMEVSAGYRGADPEGTRRWIEIEEHARQPGAPKQPRRTPNNFAKLRAIRAPVLVLAGGADLISPPAIMRIWAAHVPNHEWAEIAEAGHSIAYEQPELFNRHVLAFIGKH